MAAKTQQKPQEPMNPQLDVTAPRSMRRAGHGTTLLIIAFLAALIYLAYVLVTQSPDYIAKAGAATYGKVYDRHGDVLFDGSKPLSSYPAGQFADVGNLIGDTSGQMSNTLIAKHRSELANYSFLYGGGNQNVSLHTTLDHKATRAVYDALGSMDGTVVAYNWKSGDLLVCMSKPCVDIALGYDKIEEMPKGSLLCKAFSPTVPGSTQKVSTLLAAYQYCGIDATNGMIFDCKGSWVNASGQKINCHNRSGHGTQTLQQGFENSCNPFFAQLVQSEKLPLTAIIEGYTKMGYRVNGAEQPGFSLDGIQIPPASTTLTADTDFNTQWGCIGQGETLVTPYQLMLFQGAVASGTGKAVLPYLLSARTDVDGTVTSLGAVRYTDEMFTPESAKAVQEVMIKNAENHYYVSLPDFNCGVKSGTAQVNEDGREYENSLLAGFCLDESCPVAFCIVIEDHVKSHITSAQLAKVLLHALSDT